jgi:rhodanese-related sulfurtransferase
MIKRMMIMALVIWGCSPAEKKENGSDASSNSEVVDLDAKGFKESIDANPDAILLDVRTAEEVAEGAIPGSINIDYNAPDFAEKIGALDRSKTYYVYCMGGGRSSKTVSKMKEEGFTNLYNLEGGFKSWKENGFESTKP